MRREVTSGLYWMRVLTLGIGSAGILWNVTNPNRGEAISIAAFSFGIGAVLVGLVIEDRQRRRGDLGEPDTKQEYEARYKANYKVTGHGLDGTTIHFPCPFCAASDWHVVLVIDFAPPQKPGFYETEPIECFACARSAKYVTERKPEVVTTTVVQVSGPDSPEWVPIQKEEA